MNTKELYKARLRTKDGRYMGHAYISAQNAEAAKYQLHKELSDDYNIDYPKYVGIEFMNDILCPIRYHIG